MAGETQELLVQASPRRMPAFYDFKPRHITLLGYKMNNGLEPGLVEHHDMFLLFFPRLLLINGGVGDLRVGGRAASRLSDPASSACVPRKIADTTGPVMIQEPHPLRSPSPHIVAPPTSDPSDRTSVDPIPNSVRRCARHCARRLESRRAL
ncbi:hypothetical protein PtA15_11A137 [Puccinia triticina]|uniref:Uncharacterized protein n=1 Tax=Puccinia triticina TaxID=208348 RepID=A0ABY7CVZ7_9BASI|nr:uncharacterized protein PtA15_11A137 [Puccinia triticina]WAQ89449.1 hypothetical protein PtA15_11A137 [Puccinia triticina]WAR59507.1 hypothetical protein PtB15_11B147 [Puccinia triticina]